MQVSCSNNVKSYNLSAGKSIPEWLTDRKRRTLIKKDVDFRRRVELIQDFDMPAFSDSVKVSKDGKYVFATGTYKPRVKCFDLKNLSLKFERCMDSEVVTFDILSDDYSKLVFLQEDRWLEFHVAHGRHYRLRVPKHGRDIAYNYRNGDLYVVGSSSEIYRLNLEKGQFQTPYQSTASAINKCEAANEHSLLFCGTQEGKVEAWDTRSNSLIDTCDVAWNLADQQLSLDNSFPSVTALKFNGPLELGVGTATGHALIYDIRQHKPLYIKDHMYRLPIKDIEFHRNRDLVYSMDSSIVKIWNKHDGKLFTSIEAPAKVEFNNLCVVPNTGLLFIANGSKKMHTHFTPSLGTAPKWAHFLDLLTEELEESNTEAIYSDYKFVTSQELEDMGLDNLIGTDFLRASMHGYFMRLELYNRAKSMVNPYKLEDFKNRKIKETITKDISATRVQIKKQLPKVNKELAMKYMNDSTAPASTKDKDKLAIGKQMLEDPRLKAMFENPRFEVDTDSERHRMLKPVMSRMEEKDNKKKKKKPEVQRPMEEEEREGKGSDESSSDDGDYEDDDDEADQSSDDEPIWTKVKQEHKKLNKERKEKEREEKKTMMYESQGDDFKMNSLNKVNRLPMGERWAAEDSSVRFLGAVGSREMTFSTAKKRDRASELRNREHKDERRRVIRTGIQPKKKIHWPI